MHDFDSSNKSPSDPKLDIRLTNGHLTGKFRFKFKQHIFNWIMAIMVSGCGFHGAYLHYHQMDLEKQVESQQKLISDSQAREAICASALQQAQFLLVQRTTIAPITTVGNQDISKQ
jgi:hypothetical protein